MSQSLVATISQKYIKNYPSFRVGDTVAVHTIIRDGDKQRIQIYRGLVLRIKGEGASKSFTVRKISYGIGVEKIFPFASPNIEKIEVLKTGKVRRSKLYFMRDRVGKAAMKVKRGRVLMVEEGEEQFVTEENVEVVTEPVNETIETPVEVESVETEAAATEETPTEEVATEVATETPEEQTA